MSRDGYVQQIQNGVELLKLCHKLQTEKDGVDRPEPFVIDKSKMLDTFALDISAAIANFSLLYKLIPMMERLAALGRKLEEEGKIKCEIGDDYSEFALDYVLRVNDVPSSIDLDR